MTFEHRRGDIFAQPDLDAIGHGVNCKGKMGSGIAVAFRQRFPDMHRKYVKICDAGRLDLGMVWAYEDKASGIHVLNIASQYYPGADARFDSLVLGVKKALSYCEENNLRTLGLPQIGCGIGGLEWSEVAPALEALAADSPVHLVLITY